MRSFKMRKGKEEQRATVIRALQANDMNLMDTEAALLLYASINRAKERAGKRSGYENVPFLLEQKQSKALIQLIKLEPKLWYDWKIQSLIFAESGNEKDRPSLHRTNPQKGYELKNLSMLPYGEHQQEHAVVTGFFGTKQNKNYFEYFHSITEASKFFGIHPNVLKDIENQKVDLNGFVGMYARIEQQPPRNKAEQDKLNKKKYRDTLERIALLESIRSYKVHPDDISSLYEEKILYERFGWHIL